MMTIADIPPAMPPLADSERLLLVGLGVGMVDKGAVEGVELRNS